MSPDSDRNRDRCSALADIIYGFVQEAVLDVLASLQNASAPKAYMPETEVKPNPTSESDWDLEPSDESSSDNEGSVQKARRPKKSSWIFRREDVRKIVKANDGVTADDVICALVGRRMKARRPGALRALKLLVKSGAIRQIEDKYYPRRRKAAVKPAQPEVSPAEWVVPKGATPITAALETPLSEELAA